MATRRRFLAEAVMAIVTSTYRYKRPPKKRKPNPAVLAMPAIVTARKPKPGKMPPRVEATDQAKPAPVAPANDELRPTMGRGSAIVTIRRRKRPALADVPDMTEEEHKRRGDAADAMFRDMKRAIAEKLR